MYIVKGSALNVCLHIIISCQNNNLVHQIHNSENLYILSKCVCYLVKIEKRLKGLKEVITHEACSGMHLPFYISQFVIPFIVVNVCRHWGVNLSRHTGGSAQ